MFLASLIDEKISGGFAGFGILAAFGLWQIMRVLRSETRNWLGEKNAPDWFYILVGLACQIPLLIWVLFLKRQGYFESPPA